MSKRLFIAYKLPSELKNDMLFYQHKIKNVKDYQGINWVKSENMHITIAFLGQVQEKSIGIIEHIIDNISFSPVKIRTDTPGFFIKNNRPAILYMKILNVLELQRKSEKIREQLINRQINFDRKDFNAHITLARIKNEEIAKEFHDMVMDKLDSVERKDYTINNIVLYESRFVDRGPQYIQIYSKSREY